MSAGAIAMKYAEGCTRLGWSIFSLALLAAFVFLLGRALQVLEIGVAYTDWTGIGAVGTLTTGVLLFGEAFNPLKIAGIVLVMIGIAALKFAPARAIRRSPDGAQRNPGIFQSGPRISLRFIRATELLEIVRVHQWPRHPHIRWNTQRPPEIGRSENPSDLAEEKP
jgi:quaternary ammonium compound-resistance protein SugE